MTDYLSDEAVPEDIEASDESFLSPSSTPEQETSILPDMEPATVGSPVPRNIDEQASQLALAAKPDERSFEERFMFYRGQLERGKKRMALNEILIAEHEDKVDAAKQFARRSILQSDLEMANTVTKYRQQLEANKGKDTDPDTQPLEANKTVVARAVESVVADNNSQNYYDSVRTLDRDINIAAEDVAVRNLLMEAAAKAKERATWGDYLAHLGTAIISFADDASLNKKVAEITGQMFASRYEAVRYLREHLMTLSQEERKVIIDKLLEDKFALFGENNARKADYLEQMAYLSREDFLGSTAANIIGLGDIAFVAKGLMWLMKAGTPATAISRSAGRDAAGKLLHQDIINRTSLTGLDDAEKVSRALAGGLNPWEVDPTAMSMLSPAAQKANREFYNNLLSDTLNKLDSSGLSAEEVKEASAKLRASWIPENNPRVAAVQFGEASGDGQSLLVALKRENGTYYMTKAAAERAIRAEGRINAVPVRVRDLDNIFRKAADDTIEQSPASKQIAYHGGDLFDEFDPAKIGTGHGGSALGRGFNFATKEDLAKQYAGKYGDTPTLYKVDIPEHNEMMWWYKEFDQQPTVVKNALKNIYTPEELKVAKAEKWDGHDFFYNLKRKLGDDAVEKALREQGVKGNYAHRSGMHGKGQSYLVFDPADVRILKKTPVEKLVPKVDEAFEKEAKEADEFMENFFSEGAGDKLANRLADIGDDDPIGSLNLTMDDVTRIGKHIDDLKASGKQVMVSNNLPKEVEGIVKDWSRMLGMEKQRVIILTPEEAAVLELRFPKSFAGWTKQLLANNGLYQRMPMKTASGEAVHAHIIGINTKLLDPVANQLDFLQTLAHEYGHAFDRGVLIPLLAKNRKLLEEAFEMWKNQQMSKGDQPALDYLARFRAPDEKYAKEMEGYKKINQALKEAGEPSKRLRTLDEWVALKRQDEKGMADLAWHTDFREWFAENFAKFMLTEAQPTNAVERLFKGIADKLKAFYKRVNEALGFQTENPDAAVRELLREHIENIRTGQGIKDGGEGWFLKAVSDESFLAAKPSSAGDLSVVKQVRAGKPHIKGKLQAPAGPTEQWVILEERVDPLSYDAIGKYTKEDIDSMPTFAIDPKHAASEQAVEARVIGVHGEAKVQHELARALKSAFAPLSSASKQRVVAVLEEGDAYSHAGGFGKEFKSTELAAKGLTEPEMNAYFAARSVRMVSYHLRNAEMVRHLRAQGFKNIEVDGMFHVHGKEMDEASSAAWVGKEVWDMNAGKSVRLTADEMKAAYAGGQRIVKFAEAKDVAGSLRTVVLADGKKAKAHDIHVALGYRPGEFSRIYTDQYFIKARGEGIVDGVKQTLPERTIRTAASQREADEFTASVQAGVAALRNGADDATLDTLIGKYYAVDEFKQAVNEGALKDITDIYSHYSRNKEEYLNNAMAEWRVNNRSFYSERGEKLKSVDPTRRNTLPVMESLEAEIANISRVTNINHWREANVRRWMNTFGHLIPNRTGDDVADFYSASGAMFTKGDRESLFAERTHRYIMRQVGMSNHEEKMYETLTRLWTEKMFQGNEPIERVGAKIRDMSILGFIRNINFNLTLGMWNPAQLIVQANGAATAMVLHPLHGAKAAMTFPLLRMALMSNSEDVWRSLANAGKVATLGMADADEFVKTVKAIRKSGILDNMRSTSLYNKEEGKFNIFGGYPSKMWESKTFFFNRGEEFARVVSFDVARREWMKAHPGMPWDSQAGLHAIVTRMDDYTQNMTKANLARFQEGALSIPFQFAQYNIKLAANVMSAFLGTGPGRGFTKTEALQLMAGHILLYGAAGNGLSMLVDELLTQDQKETMSVDAKLYLGQGLIAGLINQVGEWFTGERTAVAVGSRLGSFDYYQKLADAAFKDPKNVYDVLFGPTVNTAKRLGVVGEVAYLWYKDDNITGAEVLDGLGKLTIEQVSSLRNAAKAYLYYQHAGKMIDPKGFALAKITPTEMLWQALGFQPAVAVDVHRLIQNKRDHNQALDDIASLIMRLQKEWLVAHKSGNMELAEEKRKTIQAMWPTNAGDFLEVQRRIKDRLYPYDTEMQKLLSEHMWKGGKELPLTTTTKPRKDDGPRTY